MLFTCHWMYPGFCRNITPNVLCCTQLFVCTCYPLNLLKPSHSSRIDTSKPWQLHLLLKSPDNAMQRPVSNVNFPHSVLLNTSCYTQIPNALSKIICNIVAVVSPEHHHSRWHIFIFSRRSNTVVVCFSISESVKELLLCYHVNSPL